MIRTIALCTSLTLLVAACGGDGGPTSTGPATGEPAGTVRLVTHDSFNVSEEVLDAFTDETGIEVEILASGDAGAMVNQAILTAGDPQGDVLFGVDNTFLSRALESELFVPYESPRLEAVDPAFVLDEQHRVTPVDHGDVCVNYDVGYFESSDLDVPDSLDDLTDPAYAQLLVVENPATSSPGLAFLAATVAEFGDEWPSFWQSLADGDVAVADGWEDAYYGQFSGSADSEGTRPLVVSYASSPPAEVFFAEEEPERAPTGVVESTCFRQIEFAGILAGTEREQAARQLIDFMLSDAFQQDIPLNMFVFPVVEDVALPDVFVEHAATPEQPLTMPPAEIDANRDTWIDRWTDVVQRS